MLGSSILYLLPTWFLKSEFDELNLQSFDLRTLNIILICRIPTNILTN
jgi:hypothetical protein